MEKSKAIILSGYLARTNMGHSPERRQLRKALFSPNLKRWTLNTSVLHFCQDLMENDEHETIFMEEAQSWYDQISPMTDEEFAEKWKHVQTALDKAKSKRWQDADQITKGAVNLAGITRSLLTAIDDCHDENVQPADDAAVRLIIHQMAHLAKIKQLDDSLLSYSHALNECAEKAA